MFSRLPVSQQPFSSTLLLRTAVVLIVVLSLLAGYYESRFWIWRTNHINVLERLNVNTTKEALEHEWEPK